MRSVISKLEQRMSAKEREELAAFGERFMYMPDHGTKSYEGKDDIFNAIQTSILSRKIVRIDMQMHAGADVTDSWRHSEWCYLLLHHFDPAENLDRLEADR